ncbi:phosphoribosylanthranilate isomerase [Arthrobacter alpinus]|uniref:N-(5'-phosphoribosyl)anthranilate isomerase n=1 Tax=Arthrobacter alpinus TaxID=656366 RepID=A0A1H5IU31_9MICC|nr:phosphoribosylanthranilate isomerase [Arthrobacter alpinus]SEE43736.1 phosphoribosylanthranilate isomerase [Arthrobacter alpinus]
MSALYVKICGLQTAETVDAAVQAGADAIGFIFAPGSPRTISAETASELVRQVPQDVETVGVFRNQDIDEVIDMARTAGVTTVQLHGDESLADMQALHGAGFRTLRAFSVDAYNALDDGQRLSWAAERILLDAVEPGAGIAFDASSLENGGPQGFWLLAGGLNPANVASLVHALSPTGVDVSSGVESRRGVKDSQLIRDFIHAARHQPSLPAG